MSLKSSIVRTATQATPQALADRAEGLASTRRSPAQLAFRRFTRNRMAVAGTALLVLLLAISFLLPLFVDLQPYQVNLTSSRVPPGPGHLLGTDLSGRDVFARMVYGGRVSMGIGLAAGLIAVVLGALIGAVSGAFGGWVDMIIMRVADAFLSFPQTVVVIVIAGIFGPSLPLLILVLGLFQWPGAARIVRSVVLTMTQREFVQASRGAGAGQAWLIRKHLLPAALSQIVVVFTLSVAICILQEAGLSFLGLGVQAPLPSWGNMLHDAQSITVISSMPWLWVPPGVAVAVTVFCVNFLGDGLRDAADPKARG
ncbi:ABC transporter permease [Microlunatus soli]|uniref:Peptide/nickel transport system permease protein n=1 Tax=Microlunatus soli TaxID=630515 RepID=A0A1H1R1J8_9ACTN|nr:ABC transporter permease [Microlunatus soli]SDS29486.1 peptide/nickel transport system permease protein [Microlunatus soli]